jgi:hypothetical protein
VIFPRGGGAGSGGGSGSLTSISGGTGITVSPNPITTTGTVSADLSVLMELTDTSLLNLTSRFASKLNTTDTVSLSNRINAKGNGTVTSVATAYGLTGGTITTTGTLRVDSNTVYNYVRDSIVKVRIGNDTIKILKQEYNNVTSDTLVWTTTVKFPIQLRAYILLFRNGQLLINDQFSIIDTNKIKVAASSYKLGENYTLVTVSGIGSAGVSQTGNPIYPEAGIAVSTGTTWTTSIPNNSTNWNTAFTDRLKWDGGSTGLTPSTGRTSLGGTTIGQSMFTLTNQSAISFPRFNADNSISALNAASFRSAIGAGTVTEVDVSATAGNPISITNKTTTPIIELLSATSGRNGYLTSTDWTTFNNKLNISDTASMLSNYNSRINLKLNISDTAAMLSNYNSRINLKLNISDTTNMLNPYFRDADTTQLNLTSRFATKQNNITLTTTGTSGAATLIGSTLNIPQYTGGGGGSGTVTSVGLTAPSIFTVGGSPVTTSGTLALTYSGTALPLLNGGTGATTADAALTNFGATAVGKSLFGLTNSVSDKFIKVNSNNTITLLNAADTRTNIGATTRGSNNFILPDIGTISFLRYNADNSITQLNGADFRTAIGAGTSSTNGTVTSVSINPTNPNGLTVATGTTTPVISMALAASGTTGAISNTTQQFSGAKTFLADINGSSALNVTGLSALNGGATIGTMATTSSLTHVLGVNSSNAIGEIAIGSGLSLTSGTLSATAGNDINVYLAINGPGITLSSSFGVYSHWYVNINQSSTVTITLPSASGNLNKTLVIKNSGTGAVNSNATNVEPLNSTSLGTAILTSGGGKYATLVSNGTNWIKMSGN